MFKHLQGFLGCGGPTPLGTLLSCASAHFDQRLWAAPKVTELSSCIKNSHSTLIPDSEKRLIIWGVWRSRRREVGGAPVGAAVFSPIVRGWRLPRHGRPSGRDDPSAGSGLGGGDQSWGGPPFTQLTLVERSRRAEFGALHMSPL